MEPHSVETAPSDVECSQCGCAFVNAAAFDAHRPDGKCVKPTDVGLVVAPASGSRWSVPVRVPVRCRSVRQVTRGFIDADREIAGQWDERCGAPPDRRLSVFARDSTNTQVDRRVRPIP